MDKCRVEFEREYGEHIWYEQFHEYYVDVGIQAKWEVFKKAWNASHDRCVELCDKYMPHVTMNDCREDRIRENVKSACANVIKKDKVKL